MNPSPRFPIQALVALGLLAVGFIAGRFSFRGAPAIPSSASSPFSRELRSTVRTKGISISGVTDSGGLASWTETWARLAAQPRSPAADEAAAVALQQLAEHDPERALAIALGERNRRRRADWLHAVLRGWASVSPDAAVAWIAALPPAEYDEAEGAVMDGAARTPGAAVALAQQLVQSDPTRARSHANQLLRVLSYSGDYTAAVDFASRLPEEIRPEMLGTAFQYWAQTQPERALEAARQLPAGDTRTTALDAAISGWAQGDPAELAQTALNFPTVEDRTAALQTALREWVQINPKAASEWIDRFDPTPEFDAGAAAVALQPGVLTKHPAVAASWAESITSPELRSSTLASVLREWAASDPVTALNYAKASVLLQPMDRATLLNDLGETKAEQ